MKTIHYYAVAFGVTCTFFLLLVLVSSQKEIGVPSHVAQEGNVVDGPYDGTGMAISAHSSAAGLGGATDSNLADASDQTNAQVGNSGQDLPIGHSLPRGQ